ncbi:MAG: ATP-binding protein [Kurthia sp.]|nr:ATP-binding protein [Candidatus Kurthia equi]
MNHKVDFNHPIFTQKYTIYTPPMDEMISIIGDWIEQRLSGGYLYGPSRFGKTRSVRDYLISELSQRFGQDVPLVLWSRKDSLMSEGEFWNEILKASKYEFYDIKKPKTKIVARNLVEERFKTLADFAHSNYAILLIDEAQEITLKEWKWLLGLQNNLDISGYKLSVFSIASHNINYKPNYLARTGNPHITARFFTGNYRFKGITSIQELVFILSSYEEDSEWPAESGTTYLEYFAPIGYKKGKRLINYAELILEGFQKSYPQKFYKKNQFEIPMQHIALLIERTLKEFTNDNEDWEKLESLEYWLDSIKLTGFENHISMIAEIPI